MCQVKEGQIIPEQSLLMGWLPVLLAKLLNSFDCVLNLLSGHQFEAKIDILLYLVLGNSKDNNCGLPLTIN